MKRLIILICIPGFIFCNISSAQITWDGGGDGISWSDANNWLGDVVPGTSDNVVLDNSAVLISYTVNLPSGLITTTINTLIITPSGANTIQLNLPNTNTGTPGLSVTGTGDALILNAGAILKNSSGAGSGTGITITNTFRINNGGHYLHNTARANAGIISQLSNAAGTETGEFEFDDPSGSTIVSLSGRTFGTLTLSAITNGTVSYIGSGASVCNVRGSLNINTGVNFAISMSANFIIAGNYNQAGGSTFNLQTSTNNNLVLIAGDISSTGTITESGSGLPVLQLNGTSNQNISFGSGNISNSVSVEINNSAGATLLSSFLLPYRLILTIGKITSSSSNLLTLSDDATVTGGSSSSFVNGPMKKVGDDVFTFPVGKGTIYSPIGISGGTGAATTDEFTAEYIRNNPQTVFGTTYQTGIDHISYVEYWTLTRDVGVAFKIISLDVHETSFCLQPNNTFISWYSGTQWTNEPSTASGFTACGAYQCGTLTMNSAVSAFGPFTLATDLPFNANPLPIVLRNFSVVKIQDKVGLEWELAEYASTNVRFEIQRSTDNIHFTTIASLPGNETSRQYNITDKGLPQGIIYYRLKITEPDGNTAFSRIVSLNNSTTVPGNVSLSPSVISSGTKLVFFAPDAEQVKIQVADITGKIWMSKLIHTSAGNNHLSLNLFHLPAGLYILKIYSSGNRFEALKFVRQ
jgi:hypothetical protein